jgi:hypothetical protein
MQKKQRRRGSQQKKQESGGWSPLSSNYIVLVLPVPDKTNYEYAKSKWSKEILARKPILICLEKQDALIIRFTGYNMWKHHYEVTTYLFNRFLNYDVYDEFLMGPHTRKRT